MPPILRPRPNLPQQAPPLAENGSLSAVTEVRYGLIII
jgi:hypothetical protein